MLPADARAPRARSRLASVLSAGVLRSLDPSERRKVAICNVASLAAFASISVLIAYYALSPYRALHQALALLVLGPPVYALVPWLNARGRAAWARRLLLGSTVVFTALGIHLVFGASVGLHVLYAVVAVAALVLYPAEASLERRLLVGVLVVAFFLTSVLRPPPSVEFALVPDDVKRLLTTAFPTLGVVVIWLVVFVTERYAEANETRLERASTRDMLTGLANRRAFDLELEHAVRHARRYGDGVALVYLDLDGFKPVNDVHGHAAGDRVLAEVADRISKLLGPTDLAARVGGDEFCVLLPRIAKDSVADAVRLAEALVGALAEPFDLGAVSKADARSVECGSSAGVAVLGEGESAESLLARADEAMYAGKAAGKGRVALAPAAGPVSGREAGSYGSAEGAAR